MIKKIILGILIFAVIIVGGYIYLIAYYQGGPSRFFTDLLGISAPKAFFFAMNDVTTTSDTFLVKLEILVITHLHR